MFRENFLMAFIDVVADCLTNEMVADRPAIEIKVEKYLPLLLGVGLGFETFGDIEVFTPAGEFDAVVIEVHEHGKGGYRAEAGRV